MSHQSPRPLNLFDAPRKQFFEGISAFADTRPSDSFLVGGIVRDALLGTPGSDLDIMCTEDCFEFLDCLVDSWTVFLPFLPEPKKVITFKHYRTAKLRFSDVVLGEVTEIDFSSARAESYPESGGRPDVKFAGLRDDLLRRDFSINALALSLNSENYGELIDAVDGVSDLESGVIRILHEKSFVDDPARMLRGLRFKHRLCFDFDSDTEECFEAGCRGGFLERLPRQRLLEEFRRVMSEASVSLILEEMHEREILTQVFSAFDYKAAKSNVDSSLDVASWAEKLAFLQSGMKSEQHEEELEILVSKGPFRE